MQVERTDSGVFRLAQSQVDELASGRWRTISPGTRPMPSDRVRKVLPPDTAAAWEAIAQVVPPDAYLGGGTRGALFDCSGAARVLGWQPHCRWSKRGPDQPPEQTNWAD
jgi:hypothetical protein